MLISIQCSEGAMNLCYLLIKSISVKERMNWNSLYLFYYCLFLSQSSTFFYQSTFNQIYCVLKSSIFFFADDGWLINEISGVISKQQCTMSFLRELQRRNHCSLNVHTQQCYHNSISIEEFRTVYHLLNSFFYDIYWWCYYYNAWMPRLFFFTLCPSITRLSRKFAIQIPTITANRKNLLLTLLDKVW